MSRYKAANIQQLLPSVRERVVLLLERMQAIRYSPVPFETLRSHERAAELAHKGRGISDSMHCYGAACDVICDAHGWSCGERGCSFYDNLGVAAEALGLTWGGRWKRVGKPHVQGIKIADQAAFRRLVPDERDVFVRLHLRRLR